MMSESHGSEQTFSESSRIQTDGAAVLKERFAERRSSERDLNSEADYERSDRNAMTWPLKYSDTKRSNQLITFISRYTDSIRLSARVTEPNMQAVNPYSCEEPVC